MIKNTKKIIFVEKETFQEKLWWFVIYFFGQLIVELLNYILEHPVKG